MGSIVDDAAVQLDMGLSASITDEERAIIAQAVTRAEGAVRRHLKYDPVQRRRTEYHPQVGFNRGGDRFADWQLSGGQAVLRRRGTGQTDELQLLHLPVRESPAIDLRVDVGARSGTAEGAFGDEAKKTEGTDFWPNYDGEDDDGSKICRDGIVRSFGRWPLNPGSIKVTFMAGFSAAEFEGQSTNVDASPIWDAVIEEAARRAKKALAVWKKHARAGHVPGALISEKAGDYSYRLSDAATKLLFSGATDLSSDTVERLSAFVNWGHALRG